MSAETSLKTMTQLEAPIFAVTVFPDRARITRRGTVTLTEGEHRVRSGPLPMGLLHDSVRVAGIGSFPENHPARCVSARLSIASGDLLLPSAA